MFKEELNKFGSDTVNDLIANYVKLGLRALGTYERGLKAEATETSVTITAPFHAATMEGGRKPGKFPPPADTLKWVRLGKIVKRNNITDEQLAYVVGRKIAREGIKVPNKYNVGRVISSVLADGRIEELIQDVLNITQRNLTVDMLKAYRNV